VVAGVHNPWVTTDTSFKEFEQMRVSMEPIMYQFGVDIMYNGARAAPLVEHLGHAPMCRLGVPPIARVPRAP